MTCPACSAFDTSRLPDPAPEPYRWRACQACGLHFADPIDNPGPSYYGDHPAYQVSETAPTIEAHHAPFFMHVSSSGGKRLLDIGCGSGAFLVHAQRAGFDVHGVDFNASQVDLANKRLGRRVVDCESLHAWIGKAEKGAFDVITLFEVLEHNSPHAFLTSLRPLLRPGGTLALSVPNRERWVDVLEVGIDDPPHHLLRFDAPSLRQTLEKSGFTITALETTPISAHDLSLYFRRHWRLGFMERHQKRTGTAVAKSESAIGESKTSLLQKAVHGKETVLNGVAALAAPLLNMLRPTSKGIHLFVKATTSV